MRYSIIIANPKGHYLQRFALPGEGKAGEGWHRPHFVTSHMRKFQRASFTDKGMKLGKHESERVPDRVHLDTQSFQVSKYRPREAMPWQDGTQPRVIAPDDADALDQIDLEIKQLENQSRILRLAAWQRARPLTLADIQGDPQEAHDDSTPTA